MDRRRQIFTVQIISFITLFIIMLLKRLPFSWDTLGILTFQLYPAAPPWWATYFGYLTLSESVQNLSKIPTQFLLSTPHPTAAMPSLHAAYPAYIASFFWYFYPKIFRLTIILPLTIGFAAVYLGHHYVINILAGYFYAIISFFLSVIIVNRRKFNLTNLSTKQSFQPKKSLHQQYQGPSQSHN
jgi:membrane-associated phospholipid phosphatase